MFKTFHVIASLLLLASLLLSSTYAFGQTDLPEYKQSIIGAKASLDKLAPTQLLEPVNARLITTLKAADQVSAATYFRANPTAVAALRSASPEPLRLQLPTAAGETLDLQLVPAEVYAPGFKVYRGDDRSQPVAYERGKFFRGIVNGRTETAAAITVTAGEISGLISMDGVTYNLGRVENNKSDLHVLYRADDLASPPVLGCFADELPDQFPLNTKLKGNTFGKSAENCVNIYVEVDSDITAGKGGITQAADYVSAVFAQVAIMYANDGINFQVSEMVVWEGTDPYTGPTTRDYLFAFRDRLNGSYNGDLAHLVGYQGGGGVAYVDQLCNSFYGVGYSDINPTFNLVPTYSWTVEVVTHEIGHNLGSPHTHACAWNGNGTPIDGCGPAAGYSEGCDGPVPAKGTVMSYCHLVSGVGIDLALGFGPQPTALIQDRVYNGSCLSACGILAANDAAITSVLAPAGTICASAITPEVTLKNNGTEVLTSVSIDYQVDGGAAVTTAWTGNLASGASTAVTLNGTTVASGSHVIVATSSNPNGGADEGNGSDGASGSFFVQTEQTFYRDGDGDGFGDPAQPLIACAAPAGYVSDNTDCNDGDGSAYPGAPCSTDDCITGETLDANCNCDGGVPATDSDNDGVCDGLDVCAGGDDNADADGDGIPDFCDCEVALTSFSSSSLTHGGTGSTATTVNFPSDSKDPSFTVSNLDAQLSGNPRNRYEESITITYRDGDGADQTYGTINGGTQSSGTVNITGFVQSVTVSLSDGYDGDAPAGLSVSLSKIDYCASSVSCSDTDNDGTCDADDNCPGFDNRLIGQACDDGDNCTENDVWGDDCGCAGTPIAGCSECDNSSTNFFSADPLTHVGGGASSSGVSLGGSHTEATFTISNLNARTGGKPDNRFVEQVTVNYVDGAGNTVTHGTFSGATQSSVSVSIPGPVQSISVSLSNAENTNVDLSVDLSEVTSCSVAALILETPLSNEVSLFPNPTSGLVTVRLGTYAGKSTVLVRNILGAVVQRFQLTATPVLMLDTQAWASSQVYLVTVYRDDEQPVTKRLVVKR